MSFHRSHHADSWRSRLQELDEREHSLRIAHERVMRWAEELEAKECEIEERQVKLEEREEAHRKACAVLKKRVTVLDAADRSQAEASKAALEAAAATVVQRAVRRKLAKDSAKRIAAGFRTLRSLEARHKAATSEYEAHGNRLLLDDETTKILEAADGISTRNSKELRMQRKAFVRTVMTAAGEHYESSSDAGSEDSESWVAIGDDTNDVRMTE